MRTRTLTLLSLVSMLGLGLLASPGTSAPRDLRPRTPECTISGTDGDDVLQGTSGDDVICAFAGDDQAFGRAGNDLILLGPGTDFFDGGRGNDRIRAGTGPDFGNGGRGDDKIFLQGGSDLIVFETEGADLLSGGPGDESCLSVADGVDDDTVLGGDGEDTFNADDGDFVSTMENGPTPCEGG